MVFMYHEDAKALPVNFKTESVVDRHKVVKQTKKMCILGHMKHINWGQVGVQDQDRSVTQWGPSRRAAPQGRTKAFHWASALVTLRVSCLRGHGTKGSSPWQILSLGKLFHLCFWMLGLLPAFTHGCRAFLMVQPHRTQCIFKNSGQGKLGWPPLIPGVWDRIKIQEMWAFIIHCWNRVRDLIQIKKH